MTAAALADRLSLIVIAEQRLAAPADVVDVVAAALAGGAPAVQLRNKGATARELLEVGMKLHKLTREHGALFFVNDRLDVALALGADGVHLGPDDIPVAAARRAAPEGFLIGRSADEPEVAARAVADGASYIGCGTVYPTATKGDAGAVIGLDRLRTVVRSVDVPVVGIGGITPERVAEVRASGAAGVAIVGAIMRSDDPEVAVRRVLKAGR